jgi:hypothetical protein
MSLVKGESDRGFLCDLVQTFTTATGTRPNYLLLQIELAMYGIYHLNVASRPVLIPVGPCL